MESDKRIQELKVLIVDDDSPILAIYSRYLSDLEGVSVDTAFSGKQGLDLFRGNHHHLIFVDFMMPEMDGIDFAEEVRKLDDRVLIYMITAFWDDYIPRLVEARKNLDFVTMQKPVPLDTLKMLTLAVKNSIIVG